MLDLASGPYNNNHNDKSTCSWTIHLLSACLWFLCTQSSLNLHGSYFMDSLHIITQCMEARRAQRGKRTRFSIPAERTFLSPPSCAHYALAADARLQPHTLQHQRRNIFQIWRAREIEMLLSSRLTIFLLQFQLAADCVLSLSCSPLDTLLAIVCAADASSHADLYPHAGKMPLSHDTDTVHRVYAASSRVA
jgi:hypothetical protein